MRGLTLILTKPDSLRPALELAASHAALGGRTRLFAQGEAVAALSPLVHPRDAAYAACGLPTLAELFDEALALNVDILACQSGLQLTDMAADRFHPRVGFAGAVSVLQTLSDDRLVVL